MSLNRAGSSNQAGRTARPAGRRSALRAAVIAAALALPLALANCAAPAAEPKRPGPRTAEFAWSTCLAAPLLQCAELSVPLDRAHPRAAKISLPVIKMPATRPQDRLGTLVLNRGGPGYSAVEYLRDVHRGALPDPVGPRVRERYDIVAVDQRGAGGSVPAVRCFRTEEQGKAFAAAIPAIPVSTAERTARRAADIEFGQRCRAESGVLLDHVSTEDAARDLDQLRGALGEPRLNFLGQSYGTFLGTVYANLFPDRVGRFVFDSALDPAQVEGEPGSLRSARLGSDAGSAKTMAEFLRLCAAGGERCLFGAGDPAGAWQRLIDRLLAAPVQLTAQDGRTVRLGYSEVVRWTGGWLYQPATWDQPGFGAAFLALAEQALADPSGPAGAPMAQLLLNLRDELHMTTAPYTGPVNPTALAVNCVDNAYPAGHAEFLRAVTERNVAVPHFGALRGWSDSPCASWTAERTGYRGPWEVRTEQPVLIVNSRFDPATPLDAAQRLHQQLPNSALLVLEGWGHIAAQQSRCVVDTVAAYLVDGTVPAEGASCAPDKVPFS